VVAGPGGPVVDQSQGMLLRVQLRGVVAASWVSEAERMA
jgi:hypothetical protein